MERITKPLKLALKRARENEDIPEDVSTRIEECLKTCDSDGMNMTIFYEKMTKDTTTDKYRTYVGLCVSDTWFSSHFYNITATLLNNIMLQDIVYELAKFGETNITYMSDYIMDEKVLCGLCNTHQLCVKDVHFHGSGTSYNVCVHCESKFKRYFKFFKALFVKNLRGQGLFVSLKRCAQVIEELNSTPRN